MILKTKRRVIERRAWRYGQVKTNERVAGCETLRHGKESEEMLRCDTLKFVWKEGGKK